MQKNNPRRKQSKKRESEGSTNKSVDGFFNPSDKEKSEWETVGKGLGPSGEHLTLEDLIHLRPFESDELGSTIAFRAPERMLRAAQRVKEASGGVFDIMSDLYREAFALGLLVLSDRHNEILGMKVAISRMDSHMQMRKEAMEDCERFRRGARGFDMNVIRIYFQPFMESLQARPQWVQEIYLLEMKQDTLFVELLKELGEAE